jgi:hypothetical protein
MVATDLATRAPTMPLSIRSVPSGAGQDRDVPAGADDDAQRATEPLDAHRAGGGGAPYLLDEGQLLAQQPARCEPGIGPGDRRQEDEVAA